MRFGYVITIYSLITRYYIMGVTNGKDLLSSKYPTAMIIDSVNTVHFVPIKYPVGDYFFVMINNELYAFDTKGETCKWRQKLAKTFEIKIYYTDCFVPLNSKIKELEMILEKNNLPRYSLMLHRFLSLISKKEKRDFNSLKVDLLLEDLVKRKAESPEHLEAYQNMITFINDLSIDEICTPVKRVTEYLDSSFLAPDPKFMGSIRSAFETMDREDKIVNNVEIGSKKGILKVMIVVMMVGLMGAVAYMGYEQGWFDVITNMIPSFDNPGALSLTPQPDPNAILNKYPTPEEAKAAIDSGQAKLEDFPPNIRDIIKNIKVEASP